MESSLAYSSHYKHDIVFIKEVEHADAEYLYSLVNWNQNRI